MQKLQEEFFEMKDKKGDTTLKKQEKSDKRKILPRRKLQVFSKTSRIKGNIFKRE